MINKKSINILAAIAFILIGFDIVINLSYKENAPPALTSILLGIATGILATDVSFFIENIYKAKKLYSDYEISICNMLNNIYKIAIVDLKSDYVSIVESNVNLFLTEWDNRKEIISELEKLICFWYHKKINFIDSQLLDIVSIMHNVFYPRYNDKGQTEEEEKISKFESLKVIKFCKKFNPKTIFNKLEKSQNNKTMKIELSEIYSKTLVGIVFNDTMFQEDAYNDIYQMNADYYAKYDLALTQESVEKIQRQDWYWHSHRSRKTEKWLKEIYEAENLNK